MAQTALVGGTVVTMDPDRRIIENGVVLIEDNQIAAVGDGSQVHVADNMAVIEASGTAILPGFVNTHTHVPQILLRGGPSHDRGLLDWLFNVLYPGLAAYSREDIRVATLLYCLEALTAGITTIVANEDASPTDFERAAAPAIQSYEDAGIRTIYGRMYFDIARAEMADLVETIMAKEPNVNHANVFGDTDQILSQLEALVKKYHGRNNGLVQVWPAPTIPFLVTKRGIRAAADIAKENKTMWTMHLAESTVERRIHWMSATEYCQSIGALEPTLLAAHCVHCDARDIRLLRAADVKVSTQPVSNSYLASGIAPVPDMLAQGLTVGIGTDDANCNDSVNILSDIKTLSLLHRAVHQDPSIITPEKALEMATIDGARAVGLESAIGSLEVGKQADLVLIDCNLPQMTPHIDLPAALVFQANGSEIRDVMVAGKWRIRDGRPTFLNGSEIDALLQDARNRATDIWKRAGIRASREWRARGI